MTGLLRSLLGRAPRPVEAPPAAPAGAPARIVELDEINCLVHGRHGWFLANRYDHYLGGSLIEYGEYAEIESRLLQSLLRSGDTVIEVGANIGSHTVALAKAVAPGGGVIALEPQPQIHRILCANLALNGIANALTFQVGCGAEPATMSVPAVDYHAAALHNSGSVALGAAGQGVTVQVLRLDDLLDPAPAVRLMKIDVEGMELAVLRGATRILAASRPLLYVENDRPEHSQALIEWIRDAGYGLWWHVFPLFNPDNHFGVREDRYGNQGSFNMLCAPSELAFEPPAGLQAVTDPAFHPLRGRATP